MKDVASKIYELYLKEKRLQKPREDFKKEYDDFAKLLNKKLLAEFDEYVAAERRFFKVYVLDVVQYILEFSQKDL